MIADHDRLDSFDTLGIQIVLIRIEDTRTRTDPDAIANIEARLRAQMASIEKPFAADPNMRTGKRKYDDGRKIRSKPGIRADLDMGPLGNRDVNPMRTSLGIDTLTDREARTRRERKMRRSEVGAGLLGQGQAGIATAKPTQAQSIHGLNRLQPPSRRNACHRRFERARREACACGG